MEKGNISEPSGKFVVRYKDALGHDRIKSGFKNKTEAAKARKTLRRGFCYGARYRTRAGRRRASSYLACAWRSEASSSSRAHTPFSRRLTQTVDVSQSFTHQADVRGDPVDVLEVQAVDPEIPNTAGVAVRVEVDLDGIEAHGGGFGAGRGFLLAIGLATGPAKDDRADNCYLDRASLTPVAGDE